MSRRVRLPLSNGAELVLVRREDAPERPALVVSDPDLRELQLALTDAWGATVDWRYGPGADPERMRRLLAALRSV